jgi:L-lactate dehydrogenase complex protein LldG
MSGSREKILGRIREALAVPAPRHYETVAPSENSAVTTRFREWLPFVGENADEQMALFHRQCELLRVRLCECADLAAAADEVAGLARNNGWASLAWHQGELIDQLLLHLPSSLPLFKIESGYDKDALERCGASITECESLVAQTGSICITSSSSGGRALSVLPPEHVVIARRAQLVPDLSAAYERLAAKYRGAYPSFISFVSGPSRTGDIERILVLGAHGPKKVTVLLLP